MKRAIFILAMLLAVSASLAAQGSVPTFFYVVTTVDVTAQESAFSIEAFAVINQGQHNVVLSWPAATVPSGGAAIAGYNVYRSRTTGGPYVKVNSALITAGVTYTDSFVVPYTQTLVTAVP